MWAKGDRPARDAAVIDIGSNSVRLVVYRLEGRAIWTVFNEKVLAGLGRDLARTGTLSPEGVETALAAVRRFRAVLESVRPGAVFVAATAALRDAIDGPAFVQRVRDETGYRIRVLSGMEEANYAALGVLAGAPLAQGVVGDLGGSSLELTTVGQGRVGEGITLPLGPLALAASGPFDPIKVRAAVERCLDQANAERFKTATFHAVGGAWRNLALLQMRMSDYPLRIVHQYGLSATEAQGAARFIAQQSKGSLDRIEGMSRKRSETLPYAAMVLDCLVDHLGIQEISLSAFGLREGLLFEAMSSADRALDPLVEGCAALGARQGVAEDLGLALEDWLSDAFATLPALFSTTRDRVLLTAACRLADIGARLHPDHRADLVFEQVLRAPISGMDHAERTFLALTIFSRHAPTGTPPDLDVINRLLSSDQQRRARVLGAAMRLGCDLSGRSPALLCAAQLSFTPSAVVLTASPASADLLLGEQTAKRGAMVAQILGREIEIRSA
jgi:exopolyphosphatase/guanosine-5'-triphosphate,3'-diphosphate pyrophosphatase